MIRTACVAALIALTPLPAMAAPPHWVGSWAASQQVPEPQNALAPADLHDATLRQVIRLSAGGNRIRLRLSNAFGTQPLVIDNVHVAHALSSAGARIDQASDRPVTFNGLASVTIPAGASYLSDPVAMAAAPLAVLAVSLHLPEAPDRQTGHPGSRSTSYLVHGNQSAAADLANAQKVDHWYQLAGIEVEAPAAAGAVVTLGDSITDGHGATTNGNDRWPDRLAERLQATPATRGLSVLNQGIGGNRLLLDGLGPNALARFDRDILAQPGVRTVVVLEGVNDLGTFTRDAPASPEGHAALVAQLIGAYRQIVERAHAQGVKVIGATILPYGGNSYYHPDTANEADRQAINRWIREPGHFDGVVDFDRVTRDPAHPDHLRPDFDSGDHLHPSPKGYKAMADAVPLALLR
ncbi:SGNH/GDSL hydrolase family protein [Sphingomonas oligoaromativorans]|uniref:SGNH/GDSL hydrolase family protein n=1 Tax=Sphingomonas oligoaromativorans TaxID=575322 RepID=UPI00142464E6|nr:SGNH/GDSL hydrolase family protein [Sphingomonas oligoaromativorans]NIJ33955.1 lysophospholipase L1-like esterase [Sphingomonas oligoaromativorans]